MKLDVVVPTYNRSSLLELAVHSLLTQPAPANLDITVIVVDNNSVDDTRAVVERLQADAPRTLRYVQQPLQGLSNARNAGIQASTGELVGLIDDDEEVARDWFHVVAREFVDPQTQFIGGPYLANCKATMPSWLPPGYNGVIGVIEPKPRTLMTSTFSGNLQGGNAVFRREVFERVGLYNPLLGRSGKGLLSDEDVDLYQRVLAAGLRGFHVPDLAILHHIPAERLTRSYYRRWCFWRGVSQGIAERAKPEPVPYLLRLPRYRIREGLRGLLALPRNLSSRAGSGPAFSQELPLWTLAGFVYGRFWARPEKLYAPAS